jgi:hypothetical protein
VVFERIKCVQGFEPFPVGEVAGLSSRHHGLAVKIRQGTALAPGTPSREFVGLVRTANQSLQPALSIRDLPLEVVQAILDSRQQTMTQFFRAWAGSIAKNAAADRKASERTGRNQSEAKRLEANRRSVQIFAAALNRARNMGKISHDDGEILARVARLARPIEAKGPALKTTIAGANRWSPTLEPPKG